nr:hypothetical protein [Tanacetum cinerariifolium]
MKGYVIEIQEKKAKLFNEWEMFTFTDGESIESYYHRFSKLMNDFKRNKHFLEKIASNLKFLNNLQLEWSRHVTIVYQTKDLHIGDYTQLYYFLKYNKKENVKNQVVHNAIPNPSVQNVGNHNGLIVVPGIVYQNPNGNGNGNVVAARDEGNANRSNGGLDEIKEVNANCILMANLQQASTSAEFVRDIKSLAKEADESLAKHKALELEIERILRVVVSQDIMSIVKSNYVVDTSNLQTKLERTKERFENYIIKKENEYAKLWND